MIVPANPRIAIAGATGAVGETLRDLIVARSFPYQSLHLLASQRSAGRVLEVDGRTYCVEALEDFDFAEVDIAFFSCGTPISRIHAVRAARQGALVIDNTNAFRMDPDTPLCVPQVNAHVLSTRPSSGIVANPNCSTIPLVRLLQPLDRLFGVERVFVSTYQAASGAGANGIAELEDGTRATLDDPGTPAPHARFAVPLPFNLIPSIDAPLETGFTLEEQKMTRESRKILERPDLRLTATCVRVPVVNAHSEAAYILFRDPVDREAVVAALQQAPEVLVFDEGVGSVAYPTPRYLVDPDKVHVGRIRKDPDDACGLWLWLIADNLRIGAALNAIQIAEELVRAAAEDESLEKVA